NLCNLEINDDKEDQYQNLVNQIELQIEVKNIRTAAFEVFRLLLDKSDELDEFIDENENTNIPLATFPDLRYIINQKPISQKQFKEVDSLFTPEGFLRSKVLIDI
ncbi:433_t:CDS:2, partial [Funneliformis caledonium]